MSATTERRIPLVPIERPDGRTYRPRKVVGERWENDAWMDERCGVVILGTHDVERATEFATELLRYWYDPDYVPVKPEVGWWRLGIDHGDLRWVEDERRGRAGVMFTAGWPDGSVA